MFVISFDGEFDENLPLTIYTSRDKIRLYFVDSIVFICLVDLI